MVAIRGMRLNGIAKHYWLVVVGACFALVCAGVWWEMLPKPPAVGSLPIPVIPDDVSRLQHAHWFGNPVNVVAPTSIVLKGVYAPKVPDKTAFAIIEEQGKTLVLRLGEVTPMGWRLQSIAGAAAVLVREGQSVSVVLPQAKVDEHMLPATKPLAPGVNEVSPVSPPG